MKETRNQGTQKLLSVWKKITSNISKDNISNKQNAVRDMGDAHTPFSRMDLSGLNKEQAKEVIDKLIDEKLERVSHLELSELKIDYKEKERQREQAAKRIDERRNRRKQKPIAVVETIVTEEGVYSDYKNASVFDVIQPESFPYELEKTSDPIEGQLSIMDSLAAEESPAEIQTPTKIDSPSFDINHITNLSEEEPEFQEIIPQENSEKITFLAGIHINTSLDEAIDKVFAFYGKNKKRLEHFCKKTYRKSCLILNEKIRPTVANGLERANNRVMPLLQKIEAKLELKRKIAVVLLALAKKEKIISEKMYLFINLIDRINEAFIHRLVFIRDKTGNLYNRAKEFAEIHRKKILIGFGAGVALASVITMLIGSMTAYEYIYNGKILGVVKNQEDVYKTIDIIGDKLSYEYDAEITIDKDKDIRFKKVVAFNQVVDDKEDILNRLTYMRDMKANGHGIFIDGKLAAVLESKDSAKEILDQIQSKYIKNDANTQYKKIGFDEDVTIKDVETKLGNIQKKDTALEYMMTGAVEKKIHAVQSGETFSEIAKMYGLKQSELQGSNPDVIPEKLQIGQEICLNQIVPLVTVQTVEVAKYNEAIPFEITYENTANLYKNEKTVKSKGTNGEKDVVAEVVRNNGIEVSRTEISSTILAQPVSQVVLIGTKEPPPLIGTGNFIYPIRGTLTSRFGTRWGRLHSGIDLAAPIGTYIKAADGGKVTFAGYNGPLGYMVEIDHGGGRVTWYGHCSKLFVKKGDKVFQGQHIANVGNTGHSTGPHVHFEVHINGKAKNPLNYL